MGGVRLGKLQGQKNAIATDQHRQSCLHRFREAVRDGKLGDYGAAKRLVESIRERFGEKQAEIARKEIWAAIGSGKWGQ